MQKSIWKNGENAIRDLHVLTLVYAVFALQAYLKPTL